MSFKIGFSAETDSNNNTTNTAITQSEAVAVPRKSVVRVYFPKRNLTCSYYNDAFDLHIGDTVYVDGKLEGLRGKVVDVSYTFKIKLSEYKRVIGKADTSVKGELHIANSHFVAFNPTVIPFDKAVTWFKAPDNPEDEIAFGSDEDAFPLSDLSECNVAPDVAHRGRDYFFDNRVVFVSVDKNYGKAIVEGTKPYIVEFTYQNGEISNLICDCFCSGICKHSFATLLQLKEILKTIEDNYAKEYEKSDYFAAVEKITLFANVIDNMDTGSFILG